MYRGQGAKALELRPCLGFQKKIQRSIDMAKLNTKPVKSKLFTHEGGKAKRITNEQELRRSVCSCLLWEDSFYEDGASIASRIAELCAKIDSETIASIAIEARQQFKLRHVPLLLVRILAKKGFKDTGSLLARVIQRADELSEFLSIYWKDGKEPLSAQVKKGLAEAFGKFDEYALAKYNSDREIKLRDVLFLCHAKPRTFTKKCPLCGSSPKKSCKMCKGKGTVRVVQKDIWKRLINNELKIPDTWEVSLSAGKDKKVTWERLIKENKLGALALLRNLRNMEAVGVSSALVKKAIKEMRTERVLPFRFLAAARYVPDLEPDLEKAMFKCLESMNKLEGRTVLLVDVSGSMGDLLSAKSEMRRIDAANGLAILLRELCDDVSIYSFSNDLVKIPPRRGFALRDAIDGSQRHGGTYLGNAVQQINKSENYDRLIVITDEQSHDDVPKSSNKGYMINVSIEKNGVGYGKWVHVDGFSEAIVNWIQEYEKL